MAFHTYLLRCADGSFYAGHTDDLERRIAQHQAGALPGFTRSRRPVTLVWTGAGTTREEALAFERRIKGWTRAKKEALIRGDWDRISALSVPPAERALRLRSGQTGDGGRGGGPSTSLRASGGGGAGPRTSAGTDGGWNDGGG